MATYQIQRLTPTNELTNADQLVFRVTFDQAIELNPTDFKVTGSTAKVAYYLATFANNKSTYDVTILGGDLDNLNGTVGLELAQSTTLPNVGELTLNETYRLDNTAPTFTITRQTPDTSQTNADVLTFQATFSEAVKNVDSSNFKVTGGSTAGVTNIQPIGTDGTTFNITISGGDLDNFNGSVGIDLVQGDDITDLADNLASLTSSEPYSLQNLPEIDVQGKNVSIVDGDTTPDVADDTNFGSVNTNTGTVTRTFTILNTGGAPLVLGTDAVSLSGDNASDFKITQQPDQTVAANGSTTFTVEFDPSATGDRTAMISINSNDSNENPYTFDITGKGVVPTIAFSSATFTSDESVGTSNVVTLTRSGDTSTASEVIVNITGGTATAGSDYTNTSFPLTVKFDAGQDSKTIEIPINNDALAEGNETINLSVTAQDNAEIGSQNTATLTIADNDISYALKASDTSITEGNSGSQTVTYTITRSGATNNASSVDYTIAGTAVKGTDYTTIGGTAGATDVTGSVNFAANEISKTITVQVPGDVTKEGNKTIAVSLANGTAPDGGTALMPEAPATTTIVDDDVPNVILSKSIVSGSEGQEITYTARLTTIPTAPVTINFGTDDQLEPITALTFNNDASALESKPVTVKIVDDQSAQGDRTTAITSTVTSDDQDYSGLKISNVAVDISDNDIEYSVSSGAPTVIEGNSGKTPLSFTVTRSGDINDTSSVKYSFGGTAERGLDYGDIFVDGEPIPTTGILNFAKGELTKTVTVDVLGNMITDGDRTIELGLSDGTAPGTAILPEIGASTTIVDDDTPGIEVSTDSVDVAEGGKPASYFVRLTSIPTEPVTLSFNTGNQVDAIASITFAADETALEPQAVTVKATDDALVEGNHTQIITQTLTSDDPNYNGKVDPVTVNLADNDIGYSLAANTKAIVEGNSGTQLITFTVTRSGDVGVASTVNYSLGGTTTNGTDYAPVAPTGSFSFAPGETTQTLKLEVRGDQEVEPDETISLTLTTGTAPGTAVLSDSPVVVTLINDDSPAPTLDSKPADLPVINYGKTQTKIPGTPRPDKIDGTNGNDRISGKGGNDRINGKAGDDILFGGVGKDRINGGTGNDRLNGGIGNDRLEGGKGDDQLVGGASKDILIGGEGNDLFVFTNPSATNTDTVKDFTVGEDLIDLRSIFAQADFRNATLSQVVQLVQVGANTEVQLDSDGLGSGKEFATLAILENVNSSTIGASQFVIR
jgi:Ca2+-binding RTX toxin-like protein